jgi:hypothetical protein
VTRERPQDPDGLLERRGESVDAVPAHTIAAVQELEIRQINM